MAAKNTVSISLTWNDGGGDTIRGTINETSTQIGTKAFGNVQSVSNTSEQVLMGDVTGNKYVMFENRSDTLTIYVDTATPATTGAAIKLGPGQGAFIVTTVDAYYTLCSAAGPADLGVTAVQV